MAGYDHYQLKMSKNNIYRIYALLALFKAQGDFLSQSLSDQWAPEQLIN